MKNAKPPKNIKIGVHKYKIVVDKAAIDACSVSGGGDPRVGECNNEQLTITLDPSLAPSMLQETLLHEILHAAFHFIGASEDVDDKTEEKLVLRLSPVLMGIMKSNPKLMSYLAPVT
jgi:hypothetical protein